MYRRHFVATALCAGSAAGCVGLQDDNPSSESDDSADTPNGDPTETMTQNKKTSATRHIELTNVETPSDDVPVSIGINIQQSDVTADHPARIEVGFVITNDFHLKTGMNPPMGTTLSADGTPGLVLLPLQEANEIQRVNDEMWKPDRPKDEEWSFPATAYEKDVSAKTLLTSELEVWADHRYDGYFQSGEYRFSNRFWVADKKTPWSFTISVNNPE